MKEKTSITLSKELLAQVDRLAGSRQSRSALIERILRKYLRDRRRMALHSRDLQRLNRAAHRLNREVADVLEYQASED
jgi:metal-responsive CopG/Arc/MetJ family transcriptional regulator